MLSVALRAAADAAEIIRQGSTSRASLTWEVKGRSDFVSAVDRASEEAIRHSIRSVVPDAHVLGEELSPTTAVTGGVAFVVDPLDGTTNFLHGFPEYAVSIGVLIDGTLVAAVVHHVVRDEVFTATAGGGAFLNGTPIHVSSLADPARALIGTGFPFSKPDWLLEYQPQFAAVARRTAGIRRAGSAALDLCSVAAGRFDGFWELLLAPWDIAAGLLIVREAGGIATDLTGAPAPVAHTALVAGNPPMHAWLLDTLSK